jgi:hypothetical protein
MAVCPEGALSHPERAIAAAAQPPNESSESDFNDNPEI